MTSTSPQVADSTRTIDEAEAFAELVELARKKTGRTPPELFARHVLAVYRRVGWPVQRAAMEAILRRRGFAQRDGLRVAQRPTGGVFGAYRTRRTRRAARPYRSLLESVEPLRGSCDCADFRRASLGLCKHLIVVLEDLVSRPRLFGRAREAGPEAGRGPRLSWDPVRPLHGEGDWLARVTLSGADQGRKSVALGRVARRFAQGVEQRLLEDTFAGDPRRRRVLVGELIEFLRARSRARATVEPALRARLEDEVEILELVTSLGRVRPRLRRALASLKRALYPYQVEGVERFFARGRLLLADDMGLGKTAQAIAACHGLFRTGQIQRGLLIVPASLKPQWQREWAHFTDAPVAIVGGSAAERREAYRRCRQGFLLANYEQVLRDLDLMQGWRPEIVVLDEAQRIKNWAAKTSRGVKELAPRFRLVLTGTPMENRLEELASIMDWVDDHALEPKWRLVPFHAMYVDGQKTLGGAQNLKTLRGRMAHCTVRRLRRDILRQLPPRTDTQVPVELTPEQQEEHDALYQPIASILARRRKRPLTQAEFLKLMSLLNTQRIIANGLAQLDFASTWPALRNRRPGGRALRGLFSPKLGELRELLGQLAVEQGRKVVVFSQWRRMLKLADWAVADVLAGSGLRAVFFTGKENAKRRTQNLVDFHDDPDVRVLFASDAGGVGLNLQRAANACVNLELPWNPAVLEQRVGRIHRLGQEEPIDVYNLIGTGSIEGRIAQILADKRELFRGLFDGESDEVRFESVGTFLEDVELLLQDEAAATSATDSDEDEEGLGVGADGEVDDLIACADESDDPGDGPDAAAPPQAEEVRTLLSSVTIQRTDEGGVRIQAPPEAASTLAALFEGMARLLGEAERAAPFQEGAQGRD